MMGVILFFKQKTAYELRISDWSSDVCSSDLSQRDSRDNRGNREPRGDRDDDNRGNRQQSRGRTARNRDEDEGRDERTDRSETPARDEAAEQEPAPRSEEHTSELQSLMRISYAVFCLKKKRHKHPAFLAINIHL